MRIVFAQRKPLWMLAVFVLCLAGACLFPVVPVPPPPEPPDMGLLEIHIDYTGTWYRETFNYSREAENIRHFVLIMPESEAQRASAGEIFVNLRFPDGFDGPVTLDRPDLTWALAYLYDAPEGYFRQAFAPGSYTIAAAFLAAPLTPEEAGAPPNSLYPGVTGGGASTDYQTVEIAAEEVFDLIITLTDDNGWG
jgi:hypothetical protein